MKRPLDQAEEVLCALLLAAMSGIMLAALPFIGVLIGGSAAYHLQAVPIPVAAQPPEISVNERIP
jgi:hypothetical protein